MKYTVIIEKGRESGYVSYADTGTLVSILDGANLSTEDFIKLL